MIVEKAYAKINIALDVVRKRKDGYHDLKMIMIPLELHDVITFSHHDKDIILNSEVPIENNAIIKTAKLIKSMFDVKQGAIITLEKHIPIGAGLGGGSADIAATIRGLNQLWELDLSTEKQEEIALKLGSDTLFCLHNTPAYVYGRGENLLFIQTPPIKDIYLFYPDIEVSTKDIFLNHRIDFSPHRFNRLFTLYINEKYDTFFNKTYNVLTPTTQKCHPDFALFLRKVQKINKQAQMSGSGSTVYILTFKENDTKIINKIQKSGLNPLKTSVKQ